MRRIPLITRILAIAGLLLCLFMTLASLVSGFSAPAWAGWLGASCIGAAVVLILIPV